MTRVDSDVGTATTLLERQHLENSESDTESLVGGSENPRPRRRLRLNWADDQEQEVSDSHDQRLVRVRRQLH